MNSRRLALGALLVAAAGALVAHSLVFNFVTDDAFISFVYAKNLALHGQLVFNVGEPPVEGYTNFLWTLILAAFLKLGLVPENVSRVLGTACAIATFGVLAWLSARLRTAPTTAAQATPPVATPRAMMDSWDALPALLLAAVPGYACWASGGLETQLFTLLTTLGAAFYLDERSRNVPPRLRTGVAFGLAALTRPEGILFFALTLAHLGASRLYRRQLRPTWPDVRLVLAFAAWVVPHFVWRHWYYRWWLPNTFYIKSSGGVGHWQQGGYYLLRVAEDYHLWVVPLLAAAGLWAQRERGARLAIGYATLVVGCFALYVASVAGDFMGLYRFVMPAMPLLALVASFGLRLMLTSSVARAPRFAPAAVAVLLALHVRHAVVVDQRALSNPTAPSDRGIDSPAFLRWYTADRAAIGRWFGRYARPDDYAAVGGAGAQVYYSGIRSLDCFGLSDEHIAHDVPAVSSRPGHQKYAPTDYILSKRPTIITSGNYKFVNAPYVGPDASFWMARGYHYVTVDAPGMSTSKYAFLLRNDRSFGPLPALTPPTTSAPAPTKEREP